jgi:hypothetical protein
MLLDLSRCRPGKPIGQDDFRQVVYFRELDQSPQERSRITSSPSWGSRGRRLSGALSRYDGPAGARLPGTRRRPSSSVPPWRVFLSGAQELLERVAAAAWFARHDTAYVRVRFKENGKAVAYWDADARCGLVGIDEIEEDLESFVPAGQTGMPESMNSRQNLPATAPLSRAPELFTRLDADPAAAIPADGEHRCSPPS